ncbi:MAG: hypothetical protein JWL92_441 [Candidatus Nomurabacteria bacterium]|nr:hypothetical protein [Candidatus Nomurabacteria bacterium]
MKKAYLPASLSAIHQELETINNLQSQLRVTILETAKIIGGEVLVLIPDEQTRRFLQVRATEDPLEAAKTELHSMQRTFLDIILMRSITDSQNESLFGNMFIYIDKQDLQNAGFETKGMPEDNIYPLKQACRVLTVATDRFIIADPLHWSSPPHWEFVCLHAICDFTKKALPILESQN